MGSFFKPTLVPSADITPPNVAVSAPVAPSEPVKTDSEIQAEAREHSLLRRNRGRFGTIKTGFTGFLSPSQSDNSRKTLLGE